MWKRLACLVFPLHTPGRGAPSTHLPACRLRVIAVESCDDAPPCAAAPPILTLPILTPALDCASSGPTSVRVDGGPGLSLALQSRLQRSPGYRRHKPLSGVRVQHPLREISSPAAVPPSSVTSFLRRSVFYQLASPSTCPISCCCTSLFLRLRSPCYTHDI